jgi:hypothetical protein
MQLSAEQVKYTASSISWEINMQQIKSIPAIMQQQAKQLNSGQILFVYRDGQSIRLETEFARDPYVWRNNTWRRMRRPLKSFSQVIAALNLPLPLQPLAAAGQTQEQ